jgi:AcrR family transcriptional regulator
MPKKVDHDARRLVVTEAVIRIASTRGLAAASLREVAAEAGVTLKVVQYYFHTKEQLLHETLSVLGARLAARIQQRAEATGRKPGPLEAVYLTLTAILPTDPEGQQILRAYHAFANLIWSEPDFVVQTLHYAASMEAFLATRIRQAQETGEAPTTLDPVDTASAIIALTNGLSSSILVGQRDSETACRILTTHLDAVFSQQGTG